MKTILVMLFMLPAAGRADPGPLRALEDRVNESLEAASAVRNVDRPGYDYRNFDLSPEYYQYCEDACMFDQRCKAWTYVRAGIQGPKARCWLKWKVPRARYNTCCTSGVK